MKIGKISAKGYTLMEILITISIVAVLASLGIPIYLEGTERMRANEARANLMMIYNAEMTYAYNFPGAGERVDHTYWPNGADGNSSSDLAVINSRLSLQMEERYYDLSIETSDCGGGVVCSFTATATRVGGTKTFNIGYTGVIWESGEFS